MAAEIQKKKAFGDFQTPFELAEALCTLLANEEIKPSLIIEPTCGVGNFARAAFERWGRTADRMEGFDVNPEYVNKARENVPFPSASFHVANFFTHDWQKTLLPGRGLTLVIGNLPWVTNSEMKGLGLNNLPEKNNFHGRGGFDAITGKSNFDISEWMLLRMLDWCERHRIVVALLVKTSVARKVLLQAWEGNRGICQASIHRIDTMRWFGAAADACMFVFRSGAPEAEPTCPVFPWGAQEPKSVMGYKDGNLIGNVKTYARAATLLGDNAIRWRSGIKHDCSSVMELRHSAGRLVNGHEEVVDVEKDYLFPLFKSSHLAKGLQETDRRVIITQRKVGEPTDGLAARSPKLWSYLIRHAEALDGRGSTIYKKNPRFSIFGVGDYSFSPFKVAISGLYKAPSFVLLKPTSGIPPMVDDTCYFLSFESECDAALVCEALNSQAAKEFFETFAFADAKRPYTADLLSRLSLEKLITRAFGSARVPRSLASPV